MTQYRHPDYNLEFVLELSEFYQLNGISLEVLLTFGQQIQQMNGMLIIPEENKFPEMSASCEAWLWMDDNIDVVLGTKVDIQIIRPDDSMLPLQKHKQLLLHFSGRHLQGKITRNWDT